MERRCGTVAAVAGVVLVLVLAGVARADEPASVEPGRAPLLQGSVSVVVGFGGQELATVMTEGAGTEALSAGDGSGFGVGVAVFPVRVARQAVGIALEVDYVRGGLAAGNGSVDTRRVPVSAVVQYHVQTTDSMRWQLGLGLAYHRGVRIEDRLDGFAADFDFDSSMGWRASTGFQWFSTARYGLEIAAHYESVDHEVPGTDATIDASSVGASARFLINLL